MGHAPRVRADARHGKHYRHWRMTRRPTSVNFFKYASMASTRRHATATPSFTELPRPDAPRRKVGDARGRASSAASSACFRQSHIQFVFLPGERGTRKKSCGLVVRSLHFLGWTRGHPEGVSFDGSDRRRDADSTAGPESAGVLHHPADTTKCQELFMDENGKKIRCIYQLVLMCGTRPRWWIEGEASEISCKLYIRR